MSLADRHYLELKTDLWRGLPAVRARCEALLAADPDAFFLMAERAADERDNRVTVAVGQVLAAQGALNTKRFQRLRVGHALVAERRWQEALELLEDPRIATPDYPKYWAMMARVLAGLGRLKEAHRAARRALELRPDLYEALALEPSLRVAVKLRRWFRAGGFGWENLRRLVEAYGVLDLPGEVAALLKRQLKPFPDFAPDALRDVMTVLEAAADACGPAVTLGYVQAARATLGKLDQLRALEARCLTELGRSEEALGPDQGARLLRLQRALALEASGDLDGAIDRLSRLSQDSNRDLEVREALAFFVGAHVLREQPLTFGPSAERPRILNLVPFNDELLILKMRLDEMADWVDLFVIVESTVTFTGNPKPLHFEAAKAEFAAYAHKIRHVVVDGHPPIFASPWARDFRQRDMAVSALSGLCAPEDLVLLTDVDEIVDRRAIEGFDDDFAGLQMALFRFFLNYRPVTDNKPMRPTGAVFRARLLQRFGSSYARFCLARRRGCHVLGRAGWHFTSIGDSRWLVAKINSYAHQERRSIWRNQDHVAGFFADIRDGRLEPGWERAEIDDNFPRYIRENQDALRDLML